MANRAAHQMIGYSLVDITVRAPTPFTFHDVFVFVALGEWSYIAILGMPFFRIAELVIDSRLDGQVECSIVSKDGIHLARWVPCHSLVPELALEELKEAIGI